jgi:adenosylhomocysteine nucleosidase
LVILTAVALEARAVAKAWGLPAPKPGKPVRTERTVPTVEVHLVGIGGVRMPTDLHDPPVGVIIMAGLAGGLDPILRVADIVIDDCPAPYVPHIQYRRGKIIVSPTIISTPSGKLQLFRQSGALAVDMESAAARALAAELGVAFVLVRAISDSAAEALDPAVLKMVDAFGRPRPLSIARALVRQPSLIPQLRQLSENARQAAANLAAAVAAIVQRVSAVELAPREEKNGQR